MGRRSEVSLARSESGNSIVQTERMRAAASLLKESGVRMGGVRREDGSAGGFALPSAA